MNSLGTRVTPLPHNSTIVRMWGTQTTQCQASTFQVVLMQTMVVHGRVEQAHLVAQTAAIWLLH